MAVEVHLTSTLRNLVGAKTVQGQGGTVGELLAGLDERYPGFKAQISGDDGGLHRFVNVYLNDEDIRYLQALETPVNEGDVASILPALPGGPQRHGRAWAGLGFSGAGPRRPNESAPMP